MNPEIRQARRDAYQRILGLGLLSIRESAAAGKTKLCEIEAEHLHNIPSLLDEENEHRHHYYIVEERRYYVDSLKAAAELEYHDEKKGWYTKSWLTLMKLALPEIEAQNAAMEAELNARAAEPAKPDR